MWSNLFCISYRQRDLMSINESKEVKMGDYSGSVLTWAMIKKDDVEIIFQREDSLIEEIPEFKDTKI